MESAAVHTSGRVQPHSGGGGHSRGRGEQQGRPAPVALLGPSPLAPAPLQCKTPSAHGCSGAMCVTGAQTHTLTVDDMLLYSIALALDASILASGSTCGTIIIWQVSSGLCASPRGSAVCCVG